MGPPAAAPDHEMISCTQEAGWPSSIREGFSLSLQMIGESRRRRVLFGPTLTSHATGASLVQKWLCLFMSAPPHTRMHSPQCSLSRGIIHGPPANRPK